MPMNFPAEYPSIQAQNASSSKESAKLAPAAQFHTTDTPSVLGTSTSLFAIGTQSIDAEQSGSLASAHTRIHLQMRQLPKRVYKIDEDVTFAVINPDNDPFLTAVQDANGKTVPLTISESNKGTTTSVQLSGSNNIKPGKYQITISDSEGNTTQQDFSWGVLAVNIDKSIFHPNETADISMSVLNDKGDMICDANVTLQITNSSLGIDDTLATTEKGEKAIRVSPQCMHHDSFLQPDYETHYYFEKAGTYTIKLTAQTQKGTQSISDSINVTDNIPFDIQRISPTRIYAQNAYPMTFNIKANQDFTGTIIETVPESFTIIPATKSANTISYNNMQTVYIDSSKDPTQNLQDLLNGVDQLVMPFHGNYSLTQGFGAQFTEPGLQAFYVHYGLAGHDGVDFGLPPGTPLYAVDDGDIIWSGPGDYGTMVTIQHKWGKTYYGHMSSTSVTLGQHVSKDQLVGYSGQSGEATGPHLHFGMKPNNPDMHNGYYGKIDPLPYLPYGHAPQSVGQSLTTSDQLHVLSASTSADASDAASVKSTPSVASPAAQPTPTAAESTPTPTPIAQQNVPTSAPVVPSVNSPAASSPAASENFNINTQVYTDEMLANSAQTEKVKIISWQVSLKKGDSAVVGYQYQTPRVGSESYLLGPLRFYSSGSHNNIFQEDRKWQVVSDDTGSEWYNDTTVQAENGQGWNYRKKIIIDHTKVSSPQSNFPLLVSISSDRDLENYTQSNGNDILFTDATGGKLLKFAIDSYNKGSLRAWVEVPYVSSDTDTIIYLYYGNDTAASNAQGTDSQWYNTLVKEGKIGSLIGNLNLASDSAITTVPSENTAEVASQSASLPQGWIQTQYNNQHFPTSFYIIENGEMQSSLSKLDQLLPSRQGNANGQMQPFTF